jgi:hypothetical protein
MMRARQLMNLMRPVKAPVERWPVRPFDQHHEPFFLFILTPPYSGSTALAEILNTSHRTMLLTAKGEGQQLVRGLYEKDRWQAAKPVDYESVKSVWLHQFQYVHSLVRTVDVVVEKSPPNMMRIEQLAPVFQRYSLVVNNRDPYASCASELYRTFDVEKLSSSERRAALARVAAKWLMRSRRLRELSQSFDVPLVTYEWFCESPAEALRTMRLPAGVLDTINPHATLTIKDYAPQPLSNQNDRQIARLTAEDLATVSRAMREDAPLLAFFGYRERAA